MAIKKRKISDLKFDDRNINKGSEFGQSLLEKSMRETGLGRSILTDKNNVIIAGNQTAQKASELGFEEIIEVETNGKQLVVVKRTDLDINTPEGIRAKILDNTVSKHNYIEDAQLLPVLCEVADIVNLNAYGLGPKFNNEEDDWDDNEEVSFTANVKNIIKVELSSKKELTAALKDINYLMKQKYPGAVISSK